MNKILKRRLVGSMMCFIVGVAVWIYSIVNSVKIGEELHSYLSGFSSGVVGVGLVFLISAVRGIRNPKIAENLENISQDERLLSINHKAFTITFKICLTIEAIVSLVCALCNNMEIAKCLGLVICGQLILYVVVYYIVAHRS